MANTEFDPGSVTDVTLSNGNLTATHDNTSSAGARSAEQKGTGKFYFEITVNDMAGSQSCFGVLRSAGTYADALGGGGGGFVQKDGDIYSNGGYSGLGLSSAIVNGDVIGVAVDLENAIWFRLAPSGNWNGNAGGDPAASAFGAALFSFIGQTMSPVVAFGGAGTTATENFTANFGDSAFVGAVPTGFTSGWDVSDPAPEFAQGAAALLAGL